MSTQAYDGPAAVCAFSLSSGLFAPTHMRHRPSSQEPHRPCLSWPRLMCCLSFMERPSAFVLPACHFHVYPFTPSSKATSSVRPSLTSSSLTGRITHFFSEVKKHFLHYSVFCFDLFCLRFLPGRWYTSVLRAGPESYSLQFCTPVPNAIRRNGTCSIHLSHECLLKTIGQDSLIREIGTCLNCLI